MNISEYNVREKLKRVLSTTLIDLGFSEQVEALNDENVENICSSMLFVDSVINKLDNDKQKIDYLQKLILGLLCITEFNNNEKDDDKS